MRNNFGRERQPNVCLQEQQQRQLKDILSVRLSVCQSVSCLTSASTPAEKDVKGSRREGVLIYLVVRNAGPLIGGRVSPSVMDERIDVTCRNEGGERLAVR